jgi:parallel beta-helix repeat protein
MEQCILNIGPTSGDLTGSSNLVIQAAIDYLSYLGGGTVKIADGNYEVESAIHLRSNVHLEGVSGKTVLKKCAEIISPLTADADLHEKQVSVKNPEYFQTGQSVTISISGKSLGFGDTVATIVGKEGNILYLDRQINATVLLEDGGIVFTNFPVISGYNCENIEIRNLTIDGNKANNSFVNGCRNAGFFLFEAQKVLVENCLVHSYNGDGISYQGSSDIVVSNCEILNNNGKGIHPGSGAKRTHIDNCHVAYNSLDGIFICWRVQHSVIEHCTSSHNGMSGLSIGHKDTFNVIRQNQFANNHYYGIFFRNEPDPMGANDNLVEFNQITDNGSDGMGYVGIRIRGFTRDLKIRNNQISFVDAPTERTIGVCMEEHTSDIELENNEFIGCQKQTHTRWLIETDV